MVDDFSLKINALAIVSSVDDLFSKALILMLLSKNLYFLPCQACSALTKRFVLNIKEGFISCDNLSIFFNKNSWKNKLRWPQVICVSLFIIVSKKSLIRSCDL